MSTLFVISVAVSCSFPTRPYVRARTRPNSEVIYLSNLLRESWMSLSWSKIVLASCSANLSQSLHARGSQQEYTLNLQRSIKDSDFPMTPSRLWRSVITPGFLPHEKPHSPNQNIRHFCFQGLLHVLCRIFLQTYSQITYALKEHFKSVICLAHFDAGLPDVSS